MEREILNGRPRGIGFHREIPNLMCQNDGRGLRSVELQGLLHRQIVLQGGGEPVAAKPDVLEGVRRLCGRPAIQANGRPRGIGFHRQIPNLMCQNDGPGLRSVELQVLLTRQIAFQGGAEPVAAKRDVLEGVRRL